MLAGATQVAQVAKRSLAQRQPTEVAVSGQSTQLVKNAVSAGVLSVNSGREIEKGSKKTVAAIGKQLENAVKMVNQAIKEFSLNVGIANQKATDYQLNLLDNIGAIEDVHQVHSGFADQIVKQIRIRYQETVVGLLMLQKLNFDGRLDVCDKMLQLHFDIRLKELKLMSDQLNLLRKHENYELKIQIIAREQLLKEEEQELEQYVKSFEFTSEEMLKYSEQYLEHRKQVHQESPDLVELVLKEQKQLGDHTIEGKKVDVDSCVIQ